MENKDEKKEMEERLDELKTEKKEFLEEIVELEDKKEALEDQEDTEAYDEMLDQTKSDWITNYDGGMALKEIDPIAYNCGYNDFVDAELSELQEKITELEDQITDLEKEERELKASLEEAV
jgi:uncharacterized coiled-coil DUF342 family protein